MSTIFPKEIIDNTQEKNFSRNSVTTRIIYLSVLVFLVTVLALLPVIKVDVGIRSQGILRPVTEVVVLRAPVSGPLERLHVRDNQYIEKGELYAELGSPELTGRIRYNRRQREKLRQQLDDLDILLTADATGLFDSANPATLKYQQQLMEFRQQMLNKSNAVDRLTRILNREKYLYEKNATTASSLEDARHELGEMRGAYRLMLQQQRNRWAAVRTTKESELSDLESRFELMYKERELYQIRAPVTGTVQNISGINQNSFIYHNQILGEISPDTLLVAEIHVSPRDIGLLKTGMPVRMQIDAYNYHQWGVVNGVVTSISGDIRVNGDQLYFRVLCIPDTDHLKLPNGVRGDLKKGMTFQARFIMSRRSLFQLLYDKVDDWLNPARNPQQQTGSNHSFTTTGYESQR